MNIERVNQLLLDIAESRHFRECKLTLTNCQVCFGIVDRKKHELQPIAIEFIEELCNHVVESSESVAMADKVRSSAESFVSALVHERFKKESESMIGELHELRTKDIEASKRLRIEINAMPETARTIFESARIEAKSKGVPIVRALVDMVASARAECYSGRNTAHEELRIDRAGYESRLSEQAKTITDLRDECRQHLARINVLESEKAEALARPRLIEVRNGDTIDARPGDKIKVVMTISSRDTTLPVNKSTGQDVAKVEDKAKDATSGNVVPRNVLVWAAELANSETGSAPQNSDIDRAAMAFAGTAPNHKWYDCVRMHIERWRAGKAIAPSLCTCPATSEYDDPCPRHGVVGIGITPRD